MKKKTTTKKKSFAENIKQSTLSKAEKNKKNKEIRKAIDNILDKESDGFVFVGTKVSENGIGGIAKVNRVTALDIIRSTVHALQLSDLQRQLIALELLTK